MNPQDVVVVNTLDTPYVYAAPAPSTVNSIADFLSRVV